MAVKTQPATVQSDAPAAPADVPSDNVQSDAPADPTVNGSLQSAVETVNQAIAPAAPANAKGDANTLEFLALCTELDETIRRQSKALVAYFAERGAIVAHGIDVKVSKARNAATRKELRAAALRGMELVSLASYDPAAESQPDVDKWQRIHRLVSLFPHAAGLGSVSVALAFTTLLTRVDPPTSWDAPETWEVKRQYQGRVADVIRDAVDEQWTREQTDSAIAELDGAGPEPIKVKTDDPVKAARQLAASIMDRINERKVDPETLFDELQSLLTRYGWELNKGHNGNGVETLIPIRRGRAAG